MRAFSNLRFEVLVLALKLPVQESHGEQVVDAEEQLDPVEGLRQEIARAGRERPTLALGRGVGGEQEDRQIGLRPRLPLEPLQDLHAVEVRHPQIQQDQIGPELSIACRHLARVRRAAQMGIAGALEELLQQTHHRRLVVDDHDPGAAERLRDHHSNAMTPRAATGVDYEAASAVRRRRGREAETPDGCPTSFPRSRSLSGCRARVNGPSLVPVSDAPPPPGVSTARCRVPRGRGGALASLAGTPPRFRPTIQCGRAVPGQCRPTGRAGRSRSLPSGPLQSPRWGWRGRERPEPVGQWEPTPRGGSEGLPSSQAHAADQLAADRPTGSALGGRAPTGVGRGSRRRAGRRGTGGESEERGPSGLRPRSRGTREPPQERDFGKKPRSLCLPPCADYLARVPRHENPPSGYGVFAMLFKQFHTGPSAHEKVSFSRARG